MPKSAKDAILPDSASDSDDSGAPDLECETCCLGFPTQKALDEHLKGKRHAKKLAQEKLVAKLLLDEPDDEADEDDLRCDVCDKSFSGHKSYLAHLKSAGHAKFLKKNRLRQMMANEPGILEDHGDEDTDEVVPKVFATCPTCKKEFSGPEPYHAHLKSAAHKKKVGASKIQVVEDDADDGASLTCRACSKSFSGPIPYQTHMLSGVHKKNLERAKVAEEMRKVCKRYDPEDGFVCAGCDKAFADPLMFQNHLANNSHERASAKREMKEFLARYPEIVFVAPFGDHSGSGGEEGEELEGGSRARDFYLICKLCEMSFSGPESCRAHVKSQKHLRRREKRLVLRLVEAQRGEKAGDGAKSEVPRRADSEAESGKVVNGATSVDDEDAFELL